MSIESLRQRVTQLEREKATLEVQLSRERDSARKKQAEIAQASRSMTKNISTGVLSSKQRQVEAMQRQLSSHEKKAADLQGRVAAKNAEILRVLNQVDRAEGQAQRLRDQEQKRRQSQELRHSRELTRELERQSQLHSKLSSAPIVVTFADLPQRITVLFIASNPEDQSQLRLDEEIRSISRKIRESKYRDAIELRSIWATRPHDLLQALNENKPTVVHFSGHGSDQGDLVLQDDFGKTRLVSLETIIEMFKVMASGIELVVFNACFSDEQAARVTQHVKAAIGMNDSIGDEAARVFSAQFYSAISFGLSVPKAFAQAKVALMLESIPEASTPELFLAEGVTDAELVLVQPQTAKNTWVDS